MISAVVLAFAPACAPLALTSGHDVAGTYRGGLEIDGAMIATTLELEREGDAYRIRLRSADGLDALGVGYLDGDRFEADFTYVGACTGRGRLSAEVREGGSLLLGTFEAEDCTGEGGGGLVLRRRG